MSGRPSLLPRLLGEGVVTAQQLALFEVATTTRPARKDEVGLGKEIAPGPERLLAALVKNGLRGEDSLKRAAALVLALDERTNGKP